MTTAPEPVRLPPLKLPLGMKWRAHDPQGVGHLLPRGAGYIRYLCNRMPISERYAWPMRERCPECVRVLGEGGRS